MSYRDNIKRILKEKHITQQQFANMLGITREALNVTINNESTSPTLKTLQKYADVLSVPVASLLLKPDEQITQQQPQQQPAQQVNITCPHCQQSINLAIN